VPDESDDVSSLTVNAAIVVDLLGSLFVQQITVETYSIRYLSLHL
jgi:hypothetical protein